MSRIHSKKRFWGVFLVGITWVSLLYADGKSANDKIKEVPVESSVSAESPLSKPTSLSTTEEAIPEGKVSPYTDRMRNLIKIWPPKNMPRSPEGENPVWMKAIRTPNQGVYIGTEKVMIIRAPLQRVVSVMENFEAYPQMFHGLKGVKILERDPKKITTFWERESPVFFVPNIKYEQIYLADKSVENRVVYRYQLKSGNSVNFADGFLVMEAVGEQTRLSSLDFYDGNWGLLSSVATGRIWSESLENDYRGAIEFKSRAEHPDWSFNQIKKESERMLDRFPIEPIQFVDRFESLFP